MIVLILTVVFVVVNAQNDSAAQQLIDFKIHTNGPIGVLTTVGGAPVGVSDTVTLNRPLNLNTYYQDSITHLVRENIPDRIVHALGAGAFGYFEVTHDIRHICKAQLFSHIGKKTPLAVRFSLATTERGAADTSRDVRGFAVKFYTEEGNFDIPGFNLPVFVVKDPADFPAFTKATKRNPVTGLQDSTRMWDFITLRPDSLHIYLMIFSDRGIPDGYRRMPGFSIHTYEVINAIGEIHFIRFHFLPDAGNSNLLQPSTDPGYSARDLYNAIANGHLPSWSVHIQVLTRDDVTTAGFDVFDVTKILPLDKYPLVPVGRIVLTKNPLNQFADIEQLAFNVGNLVPGLLGAPDKVFEARMIAYTDAQYYRLGSNFFNIDVNCPLSARHTYTRNGEAPVLDNGRESPDYYPNSFNGAMPYNDERRMNLVQITQDPPNNIAQCQDLYNSMSQDERGRLVQNIISSVSSAAEEVQARLVKLFNIIDLDLGSRLQIGLQQSSAQSGQQSAAQVNQQSDTAGQLFTGQVGLLSGRFHKVKVRSHHAIRKM